MTYEWEIIPREYKNPVQDILKRIRGVVGNIWKCMETIGVGFRDRGG